MYMYTYIHIHMYIYIYTYTCACICICIYNNNNRRSCDQEGSFFNATQRSSGEQATPNPPTDIVSTKSA